MRNLKLMLQYDGFLFHGFQIQPNVRTVQGELQKMLSNITGSDIKVQGCSRTDAGVHAYRYCCNFYTEFRIPAERLPIVMNNNRYVPDIRVLSCDDADDDFNARFDTKYKTYRYLINTAEEPSIYRRNYEWQIGKPLDVDAMNEAAKYIVGEHDFSSFMTSGTEVTSTVRNVFSLNVNRLSGGMIELLITADGYLYNMVRIITGTLVSVGDGTKTVQWVQSVVDSCNRGEAGQTAPPQGLYLYDVVY